MPAPPRMPFQPIHPQVSSLDPLSSSSYNGVFNFGIPRDPMPFATSPLELKVRTSASDQGNPSGNSSRPTTIQNCQPDLSKFIKQLPFQEKTEGTLLQRPSSESESDVPVYNKGFFSFLLQPEDLQRGSTSADASLCLKTEIRCNEKTGEFIDLNLKL
ncbi:uncharacterized protein LOC120206037 [Hibiscus syriacus]|uniref:uncharacterized protein LOC120206037 n=1 Tax=Hibiscus syriacus TaxID=106335 RepID=UPI001922301A|nr:uncharacterized protein LOC120206037 [Hibiscus syriacus]